MWGKSHNDEAYKREKGTREESGLNSFPLFNVAYEYN